MLKTIVCATMFLSLTFSAAAVTCPARPGSGSDVINPLDVTSQNGILDVNLSFNTGTDDTGAISYCFLFNNSNEAPTLRLNPGEQVRLTLLNQAQAGGTSNAPAHSHLAGAPDPCNGVMTSLSTNVHFHGLNVFSTCHADEVIHTLVNPGDPPFHYNFNVPANEPPGLYWYHPHPHSLTGAQILGGASGALIIQGIEKIKPEVAGLTERVLIVRQRANPFGDLDAGALTLNYVPATFPETTSPVITMQPLEKQFWRVLNAAGATFLNLQVQVNGIPRDLEVVAVDGTPLKTNLTLKTLRIPPAGRAEFIVQGPNLGEFATFNTLGADTGIDGDYNPPQRLAQINISSNARVRTAIASSKEQLGPRRFSDLASQTPDTTRHLYFTEDVSDPNNLKFWLTVQGQTPRLYDPNDPPAIVTTQGAVEDWVLRNESREVHAFHMHQLHFLVLAKNGAPVKNRTVQDTVMLDAWDGVSPTYPSVKVRMDFRYKESVGTFLYHCHILDHEDNGMMAKIQVNPAK
jgi:FtsP/CotA-like multicopper oxidase with cupredoxin domain